MYVTLFKWSFLRLFIFRQWGREREREGKKQQCMVTSHVYPTVDLACNPGMCPDWESNWRPFGLQAGAQSTEPHQAGPLSKSIYRILTLFQNVLSSLYSPRGYHPKFVLPDFEIDINVMSSSCSAFFTFIYEQFIFLKLQSSIPIYFIWLSINLVVAMSTFHFGGIVNKAMNILVQNCGQTYSFLLLLSPEVEPMSHRVGIYLPL